MSSVGSVDTLTPPAPTSPNFRLTQFEKSLKNNDDVFKCTQNFPLREWACNVTNIGEEHCWAITHVSWAVMLPDQVPVCWSMHFSRTFCTYVDTAVNHMYTEFGLAQNSSFAGPSWVQVLRNPWDVCRPSLYREQLVWMWSGTGKPVKKDTPMGITKVFLTLYFCDQLTVVMPLAELYLP
jgi:hypothetical protein